MELLLRNENGVGSITIPKNVVSIGICAFKDCRAFTDVINLSAIPQNIEDFYRKPKGLDLAGQWDTELLLHNEGKGEIVLYFMRKNVVVTIGYIFAYN